MKELDEVIERLDLDTKDLAKAVCEIMIEHYGSHNFKAFKEVVNDMLK